MGKSAVFISRYYNLVFQHFPVSPIFKRLWHSKCTPRLKFFAWLLFVDRLNTRNMLLRRHYNVQPNYLCVLCSTNNEENLEHLFFTCPFVRQCWAKINLNWNLSLSLEDKISDAKQRSGLDFFTEATLIASWELWKIRNDKVFGRQDACCNRWFCNFKKQCLVQSVRFKVDLRSSFCFWLDAFS